MDRAFADRFITTTHRINQRTKQLSARGALPRGDFFLLNFIDHCNRDPAFCPGRAGPSNVSVSALARMLGISTAAVSRLLRVVENKGYVRRELDDSDRRFVYISLSDEGEALIEEVRTATQDRILAALSIMGEVDAKALLHLLNRLLVAVEQSEPQPEGETQKPKGSKSE